MPRAPERSRPNVAELRLKRATRGEKRGGRRGGAVERITQRRTACAAVRIDQDTISNVYYYTNGGLPVRIDQEVEMTDRLQEVGFIYYRGLRTDHTVM